MRKLILILIVLLVPLMLYNFLQVDFAEPGWDQNKRVYLTLLGNVLIMISLVISYTSRKKKENQKG